MIKTKKYTGAARGQVCTAQISGVCNYETETVVFCHFPDESHGIALKADDYIGGDCCSACHDVIDGRVPAPPGWNENKHFYLMRSMIRTIRTRIESGVVVVK